MAKRINFTQSDKTFLISIVSKYKDIITDTSTKAFMVDKKNKAWEEIASQYNASVETPRSMKQLKILYDNMKRELKKNIFEQSHDNKEDVLLVEAEPTVPAKIPKGSGKSETICEPAIQVKKIVRRRLSPTIQELKKQYYKEKILNEKWQRVVLKLQVQKLKKELAQ